MAVAPATLTPNGIATAGSSVNTGGAASLQAAMADGLDTTYARHSSPYLGTAVDFSSFTLPSLAQIRSVIPRIRARWQTAAPSNFTYQLSTLTGGGQVLGTLNSPALTSAFATFTGPPATVTSLLQTQADIDNLEMLFTGYGSSGGAIIDVAELYIDVYYNEAPVATPILPTSPVATTTPLIGWTYSDPEGDTQDRFRVKVFESSVYNGVSFNPETSAAAWDSGEQASAATTVTVGTALLPGLTYRAYIKVADVGSNGRYGSWASILFVAGTSAATPTMSATLDDAAGRIALTVQGRDNLLPTNMASLEANVDGWSPNSTGNCTLARYAAGGLDGTSSLQMTAATASSMAADSPNGLAAMPILPSTIYTAQASFFPGSTARSVQISISWYDSAGSPTGSTATGTVTEVGWVTAMVVATSPANAAYASLRVQINTAAAGEVHYVDQISLVPGNVNLLSQQMSSFEPVTTDWGEYHLNEVAPAIGAVADLLAPLGNNAMKIPVTTNTGFKGIAAAATTPVIAGQTYTYGCWVRASVAGSTLQLYYSAPNNPIQTFSGIGTSWQWISFTMVPTGTGQIFIRTADANRDFYIDGVMIAMGSPTTYVPAPAFTRGGMVNRTNLLSENTSNIDTSAAGWAPQAGGNCAVSRSTAAFTTVDGVGSLALTSSAAGNMNAESARGTSGVPILPNTTYSAWALTKASTVARSINVTIAFYDAAGTLLTYNASTNITNNTSSFVKTGIATLTSPANAAYANMVVTVLAAGAASEVHYFDFMFLGQTAPLTATEVQRSSDGGATWTDVRGATATTPLAYGATTQLAPTLYDYEAPRGVPVIYRSRTIGYEAGAVITSGWSIKTTGVTPAATITWVKDPLNPALNIQVVLDQHGITPVRQETMGIHWAQGRADPIILRGTVRKPAFTIQLFFANDTAWNAWKTLQDAQRTLLLQTCFGDSSGTVAKRQYYFVITDPIPDDEWTLDSMATSQPHSIPLGCQETAAPALV